MPSRRSPAGSRAREASFSRSRQVKRSGAEQFRPLFAAGFLRSLGGSGSQDKVGAAPLFVREVFAGGQTLGQLLGLGHVAAIQRAKGRGQRDRFGRRFAIVQDHGRGDNPRHHRHVNRHGQHQSERVGQHTPDRGPQSAHQSTGAAGAVSGGAASCAGEVVFGAMEIDERPDVLFLAPRPSWLV